jgi:hypothetical protein
VTDFMMPTQERQQLPPIIKRERIGDRFKVAIIKFESRDRMKKDASGEWVKILKPGTDKAKQELVVTALVMPGTTCPASLGDYHAVPEPGDLVRVILAGGAYGDWIEATKSHRNGAMAYGDILKCELTFAQAWNPDGTTKGGKITDQAEADKIPRGTSLGYYGKLELAVGEGDWPAKCKAEYDRLNAAKAEMISTSTAGKEAWDEEPF